MIQFNLLPDVKKQYVKAKRTKRLIMTVSFMASAGMVAVLIALFSYAQFAQKKHISDLGEDIKSVATEIQTTPGLNTVLSVQNQLVHLPGLHQQKPHTSRLFDYVKFVSPKEVSISQLTLDGTTNQITMSGQADSIATINKFVDNIKSVRYSEGNPDDGVALVPPFNQVATELSAENDQASFEIVMTYDPLIFSNPLAITMSLANESIKVDE